MFLFDFCAVYVDECYLASEITAGSLLLPSSAAWELQRHSGAMNASPLLPSRHLDSCTIKLMFSVIWLNEIILSIIVCPWNPFWTNFLAKMIAFLVYKTGTSHHHNGSIVLFIWLQCSNNGIIMCLQRIYWPCFVYEGIERHSSQWILIMLMFFFSHFRAKSMCSTRFWNPMPHKNMYTIL